MAEYNKWNVEQLEALRVAIEGGATVAALAKLHGVSRIRIYQLLKRIGFDIKTRKKVDVQVPAN